MNRRLRATPRFLVAVLPILPVAALAVVAGAAQNPATKQAKPALDSAALFDKEVWPILQKSCVPCHAGKDASGELDLTTRETLLKGGSSGPSISTSDPEASLLLRAVHYDGRQMPPQGRLPQAQIAVLSRWVRAGVPWSKVKGVAQAPVHHGPPPVDEKARKFWAFRTPVRPTVPKVTNADWAKNPIDAFVFSKLAKHGLQPAVPASRATLIRRAYYDATGLPPTPADVRAFVNDTSPNAWEKVVDRLLASPRYGEQWGRHWLDLVRYAETNSYERDGDKPFVWRYRDYVIDSFNQDKPYTQFIREQIAGDEMPGATTESLIATGYYRLGLWDDEPSDPEQARFDDIDDIVSTTGQTFLGLTVGCARCHDHKIDPFPTRDYYSLVAFFRNVNRYGERGKSVADVSLRPISPPTEQARFAKEMGAYSAQLADLDSKMKPMEAIVLTDLKGGEKDDWKYEQNRLPLVKKRSGNALTEAKVTEYTQLWDERAALRAKPPKGLEMALCVTEAGPESPKTFVLARGSVHGPGAEVAPGFPEVLTPPGATLAKWQTSTSSAKTTGRRLALADWLASSKNPMTARVMANRVWQFHFGRGIVRSTSNFGYMGTMPTHPELLDYLSTELVRNGWKLKPLHRQILLSNTYRMSSKANGNALAKDPENDLMWRFDMRRLTAEEMRDSVLAVSGGVNTKMHGPSVLVTLPQEVLAGQSVPGQGWGQSAPEEQRRRSVYVKVKRSLAVPVLASFDAADTDATCPVRFATTQPTQALGMLNSTWTREQAEAMTNSVKSEAGNDPSARVKAVLWRVFQRAPSSVEIGRGVKFLTDTQAREHKTADAALSDLCLLALNLNEFTYLD